MSSQFTFSFPGGAVKQVVTSITLVNATAKTQDTTVPSNKKWVLLSVKAVNADNVNRVITLTIYKEAAKTNVIKVLDSASIVAGTAMQYPSNQSDRAKQTNATKPAEILTDGNTLTAHWASGGASAGGTDADGLVLEYLEVYK